jgi:transcription elongation GreA/GreB family factor
MAANNVGRWIRFDLDGMRLERRLVETSVVDDPAVELSKDSPVGRALLHARAGDEIAVPVPAGAVTITVRSIEEGETCHDERH